MAIALDAVLTGQRQRERTLPLKSLKFKMHRQRPESVDEGNMQTSVLMYLYVKIKCILRAAQEAGVFLQHDHLGWNQQCSHRTVRFCQQSWSQIQGSDLE